MKTVRVRIAVAVNERGYWSSCGCGAPEDKPSTARDRIMAEAALDELPSEGGENVVFIEADVPVPEPKTIEGTVIK
ncbi:MAG TPA: hypothetical protein VD932_02435 [Aquabacterium sp.]|nr:hypothetical protein [Aquabacterium sp.]